MTAIAAQPQSDDPGGEERPADGRSARAARTRGAIVDACIGLVEGGELRPTAPQVAERAGVSVRSVFQHFDDLPSLHTAVMDRIVERLSALVRPVDTEQPLERRIEGFVRHRAALLEAVTPYRRAANVHAPFAPEIRERLREGIEYLRREVADAFRPELDRRAEPDRGQLLHALTTALSWPAWDALRTESGCGVPAARAATTRTVRSLLGLGSGAVTPDA